MEGMEGSEICSWDVSTTGLQHRSEQMIAADCCCGIADATLLMLKD